MKYSDKPEKFMDSELELYQERKRLHERVGEHEYEYEVARRHQSLRDHLANAIMHTAADDGEPDIDGA